eukprot:TRINITY_DN1703_c0_g1_i1.p1 TRINITY_DN1703_c0_g1~~TRINITY_DN1703_c0_g1_i1.p1  ORF type:complete len:124 (+),score=40.66 TRINITY_DN1703_c0_g1_i1:184-555(+)
MKSENDKLQAAMADQDADAGSQVRIEMGDEGDDSSTHIQMDLMLGLFELRSMEAVRAAERAVAGAGAQCHCQEESPGDNDSSDHRDEEAESGEGSGLSLVLGEGREKCKGKGGAASGVLIQEM